MARDDLTFKIVKTNPIKGTVTLRPTFGTLLKLNFAALGLLYVGYLMVDYMLEDVTEVTPPQLTDENPSEN